MLLLLRLVRVLLLVSKCANCSSTSTTSVVSFLIRKAMVVATTTTTTTPTINSICIICIFLCNTSHFGRRPRRVAFGNHLSLHLTKVNRTVKVRGQAIVFWNVNLHISVLITSAVIIVIVLMSVAFSALHPIRVAVFVVRTVGLGGQHLHGLSVCVVIKGNVNHICVRPSSGGIPVLWGRIADMGRLMWLSHPSLKEYSWFHTMNTLLVYG